MSTPPLMRGFERLRQVVTEYLQVALPYYIDAARMTYGLSEYELPYPTRYDVYEPSLANDYPVIGMFVTSDRGYERVDVLPDASQVYKARYSTRLMVCARTPLDADGSTWLEPEKETAIRLCNDLTAIMRGALLQSPGCGHPDEVEMDESTLSTDYMEPIMVGTQHSARWLAMSSTSVDFCLTERTYALPYGVANQITVQLGALP